LAIPVAIPSLQSQKREDRTMAKLPVKEKRTARHAVRIGRPPRERAGEVDARILDAARRVFLESGFAGASMEEIASRASAGKPTIYARFPSKEALFTAVVMRNVAASVAQLENRMPTGERIEERLASLGATAVHWALAGDAIGLMRVVISEARRFPDLASNVERMTRERAAETIAPILAEVAQSDALGTLPAFAPERLATTTRFFNDLVVLPMIMRALFGQKLKQLRAEIGPHVARSVTFFLGACGK
jgi:AcrR family transcriptional regulator